MFIRQFSIAAVALISTVACTPKFTEVSDANLGRLKIGYGPKDAPTATCLDFAASVTPEYLLDASGEVKYKSLSWSRTSKRTGNASSLGTVSELVLLMQGLAFRYCEAVGNGHIAAAKVPDLLGKLTTSVTQILLVREGTTLKTAVELRSQYTKELKAAEDCASNQKELVDAAKSAYTKVCDPKKSTEFDKLTLEKSCADGVLIATACAVNKDQVLAATSAACSYLQKQEKCIEASVIQAKVDELDKKMLKALDLLLVIPAATP